jgi:hypothetical protein
MARGERNYKKHFYFALAAIILLLLFIAFSIFRVYVNYHTFEEQKHYFKNSGVEAEIEPWMNIKIIEANFNISKVEIVSYFNKSSNEINSEASLYRLCKLYKQNCTIIIDELNRQK